MYVRYLQHEHHGTVQLLMMPLNTAQDPAKGKRGTEGFDEDYGGECEPVPLPIQTFLWRQTNPFLGAKIGKLHESSCVTFERVVVQNILHGLSPSLSDAIAAVSRWRFVRAAFPHIVQCCGALLNVRSNEDESLPMSGSLVKILYILHWLILDAANECSEMFQSVADGAEQPVRRWTYSIPGIQMFVYLITPLCHVVKEEEIENHIRLESGLRLWQALWQFRQPDVLCFSAPVKQRRNQLPQFVRSRKSIAPTAMEQGIYLGDESQFNLRRPSQALVPSSPHKPVPKPSPTNTKVEEQPKNAEKTEEKTTTTTSAPTSGIVRSVSDYKANEDHGGRYKLDMRKSKTDLFGSVTEPELNGFKDIDEAMKFNDEGSFSESFQFSDKAPLVQLQEICSGASLDTSDSGHEVDMSTIQVCGSCSRRPCQCRPVQALTAPALETNHRDNNILTGDDSLSLSSQQTVINRNSKPAAPLLVFDEQKDSLSSHTDKTDAILIQDPNEATFLDVGTLRCLLIRNWSEYGVFWAVKYLLNRLGEIKQFRQATDTNFRSRSNSVPTLWARGVKPEKPDASADYLTWADFQERAQIFEKKTQEMEKGNEQLRVAFDIDTNKLMKESTKLKVVAEKRRVSVNTIPTTKKLSKVMTIRRQRSKSEPALLTVSVDCSKPEPTPEDSQSKASPTNFYPEAIGSAMFIEKNGHLKMNAVLKILVGLVERCSTIRILELVLNICDTLLAMPGTDLHCFFTDVTQIVFKTYIHLGCPNGCNEGMRTPQADFMRVKLKNLMSQMYRSSESTLTEILRSQVIGTSCQLLLDLIHAMTSFCEFDPQKAKSRHYGNRRRSSVMDSKVPSYRNNFNEQHAGMEGIILNTLLNPLISKLVSKQQDMYLPENMGLYQDVQLFVAYVHEYHGNPIRRTALSALAARFKVDEAESTNSRSDSETTSTRIGPDGSLSSCQKDNASLRRGLFKKKGDKFQTINAEESEGDSSPSTPRNQPSMDESLSNSNSPLVSHGMKKKSGGKLHFAFNLLKSVRNDASEDDTWDESVNLDDSVIEETGNALGVEAKSRISFRNVSAKRANHFRQRQSLSIDTVYSSDVHDKPSVTEVVGNLLQLYLPPKKVINLLDVREGVKRFSFLMETCRPGQIPDAPLLSALTELKSPVLSRAAILLECSHFVYRCNRGDWPEWIKTASNSVSGRCNVSMNSSNRHTGGGSRKMFILQRAAGRSFYEWAIQIGARLKKLLEKPVEVAKDSEDRRRLKLMDDIEDFLDDGSANDSSGELCPPALQLMACHLLLQITAFMRETFPLIPRTKAPHRTTNSSVGWERIMTNRRWSILSNTFNNQTGSIHSINDLHPNYSERRVSYSTADEESSPRGSHDLGEDGLSGVGADKKVHEGNGTLLALHRLTSRGRLFSREASLNADEAEPLATHHRILRPQNTVGSSGSAPISSAVVANSFCVPDSVRRLAQGRQRLLKRGSPASGGGPQSSLESSRKRRETSFRRKTNKSPTVDGDEDASELSSPVLNRASWAERRRKATSLRCAAGVRWHMRSMRLKGSGQVEPACSPPTAQSYSDLNRCESSELTPFQSPDLRKQNSLVNRVPPNGRNRDSLKPAAAKTSSPHDEAGDFDAYASPERRPGSTSYQASQPHNTEEEEEEMMRNLPWTKRFDMDCTHERHCTAWCFDRVYRQCNRLSDALCAVYSESTAPTLSDRRAQLLEGWQTLQTNSAKKRSSNPRRESAVVRQSGIERVPLALRGLLIEKLGEIEETKSNKKEMNGVTDNTPVNLKELLDRENNIIRFVDAQLFNMVHAPLSALLKSAVILPLDDFKAMVSVSWSLLTHADLNTVATSAAMFITCAVKCPDDCVAIMKRDLSSPSVNTRTAAVRRFYALWRNRFHVWYKLEDGAQFVFKVPPPGIDFTLPSPPIGQSQQAVVDPPWMPHVKTKVEELSLKEEEHSTSQTIMTMTRTRRKQKQEMVKKAVKEAEERQCELRQQFCLRATPIVQQASYEPALFAHINVASQMQQNAEGDDYDAGHAANPTRQQMPVAQPLFPSTLLSVVPQLVEMFDDVQVDSNGTAVGDYCRRTAWSCIVEDSSLFLRHFLEKLTHKDKQEHLFALLRKLILSFRPLPTQTGYVLLNYLFGFVMFYVRTPCEGSDRSMGLALSLIWLVTPYVHGLYFKDLKQTLKKEQCDQAIMITANVPCAKKIIVHGPDSGSGGIPSQFLIHEETQFQQVLTDSIEFFNIPEDEVDQYFLVDFKTHQIHMPSAYVRDYYFFHRSFYPQLSLVKMDPDEAQLKMKVSAFQQKLIESGKVLLTHYALKHSPEHIVPQRIFFLHDEFTHLPSFPRRSLESCFGYYQGNMGLELQAMDSIHKFVWSQLVSDMFEKMENAFMFGDLHLFINVINGILIVHCEDVLILRRCMSTYLTMAIHFNTLFASQGFFLIMPTILRCYSQRQTNKLFTNVVEFVCKQFYILHRKPFLLQMFGSIADICDQNNDDLEINAMQVKAKYLFNLLLAMENMDDLKDQLDILPLVPYSKPLKALDLCYRDDPNTFMMLPDALASCVTVCAFAPESKRSHQMMLIIQATLPHYIAHLESETTRQGNSPSALKHEIAAYTTMCVEMKALVNSCEALSRGPARAFDIAVSSDRGKSFVAESPQFFDPPTVADDEPKSNSRDRRSQNTGWESDNSEMQKELYRGPREALLVLCALFMDKAGARLKELSKLAVNVEHTKIPELFDAKCHVKISDVALSLLKVAPYDLTTMGSQGLQKYFLTILPVVDWSVETSRSALNIILRRLDKTISKIAKKSSIRKRANWYALANWLTGLYQTLVAFPYIAHLHPLKTITQMCLRLTAGDHITDEVVAAAPQSGTNTILNPQVPPSHFCAVVLKMTAFMMQALGQAAFSLETICSHETLGMAADRLEAVMCHILIPLFLAAAAPGKEAPQLQAKEILFCLNLIHNAISPPPAKQAAPATAGTTLASTLIRGAVTSHNADASGRQGSISVTDKGHSATVSTHRFVRDSVVQSIFLTLKIMIISLHRQMTSHWIKVSRIVKDIASKRLGGAALYNFIEFLTQLNLPVSLLVVPIVQQKLYQRNMTDHEAHWFNEFIERLPKLRQVSGDDIRGYNQLLSRLQQEANHMKEDFSSRVMDLPRSHTPTIGDLHSDSGSTQSVSAHKTSRLSDARRLSTSTAFNKLRSGSKAGLGHVHTPTGAGHNLHDSTILEDIEDDTTQMITGKVPKSPSLPGTQTRTKYMGMFRSIRRKSTAEDLQPTQHRTFELRDVPHRRTMSWRLSRTSTDDPVLITPLTMPDAKGETTISSLPPPSEKSVSGSERHRVVSFSTPKTSKQSESSDPDSDEYCITAKHHLI